MEERDNFKFEFYRNILFEVGMEDDVRLTIIIMLLSLGELELGEAIALLSEWKVLPEDLTDLDKRTNKIMKTVVERTGKMKDITIEIAKQGDNG